MATMYLTLNRTFFGPTYTIGKLSVDGIYHSDTIEDVNRDLNKDGKLEGSGEIKVQDKTAIPFGTYKIILNMSNRFKKILPLLIAVPGFDGIRIHSGNDEHSTSGCIIVGTNDKKGWVSNSKVAMEALMKKLQPQFDLGQEIFITIR